MQTIDITSDLNFAMGVVEDILNGNDGEAFLNSVRKYKKTKELDNNALLKLGNYLK